MRAIVILVLVAVSSCLLAFAALSAGSAAAASNSAPLTLSGAHTNAPVYVGASVQVDDKNNVVYKLPDFFSYTFTALTIFVSLVTLVFGTLVAVNVVSANRTLKAAQVELRNFADDRIALKAEIATMKKDFIEFLESQSELVRTHTERVMNDTIQCHYERIVIQKVKKELLEELAQATPVPARIFPRLTDILEYPDATSMSIFVSCLEKCSDHPDIKKKATEGLGICASRYPQDVLAKPKHVNLPEDKASGIVAKGVA